MANVLTSCDHPQNEKLPHKIFNKHDDLVNDKAFPALPLKATTTIVYIRENLERRQNLFYNKKGRDFFLLLLVLLLPMNHLRVEE